MEMSEEIRKKLQEHFDYTDEEMTEFLKNPRNIDVLTKAPALMGKTIVFEVVESNGCNSQHKVGDKFYYDGAGNLITKLGPKRMCTYALHAMTGLIFSSNELFYAGVDPNEMRFKKTGCFDVGVRCGGQGHIVMELKIEDR